MEPVWWDWGSHTEDTWILKFAWHGIYKIMLILPGLKDHIIQWLLYTSFTALLFFFEMIQQMIA